MSHSSRTSSRTQFPTLSWFGVRVFRTKVGAAHFAVKLIPQKRLIKTVERDRGNGKVYYAVHFLKEGL